MNYINNSIIDGKKFLLGAPNDTARQTEQWLWCYPNVFLIKQTNTSKCSQLHATSTHLILYPLQYDLFGRDCMRLPLWTTAASTSNQPTKQGKYPAPNLTARATNNIWYDTNELPNISTQCDCLSNVGFRRLSTSFVDTTCVFSCEWQIYMVRQWRSWNSRWTLKNEIIKTKKILIHA